MYVRLSIDSRDQNYTKIYWKPDVESDFYRLYVSTTRTGSLVLVKNMINNVPDPITLPTINQKSFNKPGRITTILSNTEAGVTTSQEFFVAVTCVHKGVEENLDTIRRYHVKLPGKQSYILRNVDSEIEKGVLAWDEHDNMHKRVSCDLLYKENDDQYALNVKLRESLVEIKNQVSAVSNLPIPLEVISFNTPNILTRSIVNSLSLSTAELLYLINSPVTGSNYKVHTICIKYISTVPRDGYIKISYKVSSGNSYTLYNIPVKTTTLEIFSDIYIDLSSELYLSASDSILIESIGLTSVGSTIDIMYMSSKV